MNSFVVCASFSLRLGHVIVGLEVSVQKSEI
jgi:hypothetical protein